MNLFRRFLPRGLAFGALLFSSSFVAAQSWTFDTDAQGWIIRDLPGVTDYATSLGTYALNWNAAGGSPGGYVSQLDPTLNTYFFEAPTAALGNYSGYVGGQLTFALQTTVNTWTTDSVVVFRGGASNLTLVTTIAPLPGTAWSNYTINLTADQFRYNNQSGAVVSTADFAAVLGSFTGLLISAEYGTGTVEVTGLDSVSFSAVPEPATAGLVLGGAAAALVLWRRRRR